MQSTSERSMNIAELANQLRREKIFINSERQLLQNLNEEVEKSTLELLQAAWEAKALGELLGWLRESPHLVALCLLLGEDRMPSTLPVSLVAGLYGSCRSQTDRTRLLAVLRSLIKHQLVATNDPRKLFRTGKCALAQLYGIFRDGHTPARQFLIAALEAPVMAVLHEDEFFLDIDPDKAMERFTSTDLIKKFGQPNSAEYTAKVSRYRKWIIQALFNLTNRFIESLKENWPNFPVAIAWIVQQIVHLLKKHSRLSEKELHALCTDLILNHFICPAIVNPEAHGVVEVPVSYVARFNLIQVAQIIQMLCLSRFQEVEPKLRDLYGKFERSCIWSLVETVAGVSTAGGIEPHAGPHDQGSLRTEPSAHTIVALYTKQDLHILITFLKQASSKLNNNTPSVTSEEYSSGSGPQPENFETGGKSESGSTSTSDAGSSTMDDEFTASLAALLQTIEPNYRSRLHDLLRKLPDFSKLRSTVSTETKDNHENGSLSKRSLLAKVPKPRLPRSASSGSANALIGSTIDEKHVNGDLRKDEISYENPEVLIIKLANVAEHDYVGLVPESKVLECYYGGSEAGDPDEAGSALAVAGSGAPVQKRTRFSVSHDEVSLGNTSDNLEAVSEAASNHSVTSSLELETEDQNDNLSDMVSANVSGRGSPNISGRETPSSQVTDGDGAVPGDALPPRRLPQNIPVSQAANVQAKMLKQTRNDIEDKFCKFEIRRQMCLPAAATSNSNAPDVSETASESAWSVDVLASDSDRNTEVDTDDCVSVAARSDTSWPRRPSHQEDTVLVRPLPQGGPFKRPDVGSPRHRQNLPNRSGGYLSATAQLSRGVELDLMSQAPRCSTHNFTTIENRKSILVNGYPVMTCFATSAPESPSMPMPNDVFDNGEETESTLDGGANSDATSQWVDDSFPQPHPSPPAGERPSHLSNASKNYDLPSTSKPYEDNETMDGSLNSSESSFNALSASQFDNSRFDSGIESTERPDARSTISDLMTRMSSATISTSANIVNNVSRIVKSEIRTSMVSISSSRIDRGKNTKEPANSNISLSTLSVNSVETSVSDKSSSQDVNSENVTERRVSPPPLKPPSTGAIPKSISFDSTAEKNQRRRIIGEEGLVGNLDELKNNMKRSGGNLLHKIKMFRHKSRGGGSQNLTDMKVSEEEQRIEDLPSQNGLVAAGSNNGVVSGESSEEILAKYRRKSSSDSSRTRRSTRRHNEVPPPDSEIDRCEGVVDLSDPEVFSSMKRKLRMVLSNPDLHAVEYMPNRCTSTSLVEWVRAAAACAPTEESAARAGEVARVLAGSGEGAVRLAAALRADLAARRPYAAYLASCRAGLTHTLHSLNRHISAVRAECAGCARVAAAARVLEQLERGRTLRRLTRTHHHHNNHVTNEKASNGGYESGLVVPTVQHSNLYDPKLSANDAIGVPDTFSPAFLFYANSTLSVSGELMDEKATRLTATIKSITAEVKADPSWEGASAALLETAEVTVERAAFARLYLHVLFPNGDGDIARDQVLSEHIRRLAGSTSAASVGVAARHLWAAPYPRAQLALTHLAVYRTPRDKVWCVMRCVRRIMAVLGLTEGAAPAADDLTPVLVYVILRVNPPSLLSTIELVNAWGASCLHGEALYWWTHFCAAVAHIKTMDYPHSDT
ncbi:GTPase-activating protein and VPS9 domain-containing protein 1 [Eumeta japonica]|uniref:GTPase-activating protein and VPS9 domain-containing protein 1 n=1 Tax=Eumeta variegata TaxID=151549 RepID=A0A4C1T255_EUMVA|nr:GTPase-activating protein and VPS9 domain-containing protein 1 [Eumeta japonica]